MNAKCEKYIQRSLQGPRRPNRKKWNNQTRKRTPVLRKRLATWWRTTQTPSRHHPGFLQSTSMKPFSEKEVKIEAEEIRISTIIGVFSLKIWQMLHCLHMRTCRTEVVVHATVYYVLL